MRSCAKARSRIAFYVIVQGRVNVEADGRVVGGLEAGECFGEASYISDAKLTSTVKAETMRSRC